MATVNPKVAASADDGIQTGAGTNANTGTTGRIRDTGGGLGHRYIMCRWLLTIPQGSTINSATIGGYVNSHADDLYCVVAAQSIDDAPAMNTTANDIGGRTCGSTVTWNVASGSITDGAYLTKDVTSIVQTVINRAGWVSGNYLALRLYNDTVNACDVTFNMYDGDATKGLQLTIDYTAPASNNPPSVNAGADQKVGVNQVCTLDGTVTDDGLPASPGTVTTQWQLVSGVGGGSVTFANDALIDTTCTFNRPGHWSIRLYADDGDQHTSDACNIDVWPRNQLVGHGPLQSFKMGRIR